VATTTVTVATGGFAAVVTTMFVWRTWVGLTGELRVKALSFIFTSAGLAVAGAIVKG
jgi:hypothetical protein